jgi:hypothetical protein
LNSAQSAKGLSDARDYYVAVRGLQEPQLHDDKKQEEALRPFGDEEVLQHLPSANGAQRSEVALHFLRGQFFAKGVFAGARAGPELILGESSNG